jgi:hypothetical protein
MVEMFARSRAGKPQSNRVALTRENNLAGGLRDYEIGSR